MTEFIKTHQATIAMIVAFIALIFSFSKSITDESVTVDHGVKAPDHVYELEINGINPDVYEFTPVSNPKMTCFLIDSTMIDTPPCIPKPDYSA